MKKKRYQRGAWKKAWLKYEWVSSDKGEGDLERRHMTSRHKRNVVILWTGKKNAKEGYIARRSRGRGCPKGRGRSDIEGERHC